MNRTPIEEATAYSCHDLPQTSPQEYDCGCVTEVYVTDRDALAGEKPFEMRLTVKCDRRDCNVRRKMLRELLVREDLLSSRDWPWTTAKLLDAHQALTMEQR